MLRFINSSRRLQATSLALAALLLIATGCDDGRPRRVPVSGRVTIDGKPLKYGFVRVTPSDARAASAKLDEQGRFALKTFEDGDGVVMGTHPVAIVAGEYISDTETFWHAPEKYSRESTSGITIEVTGPQDDLNINLTWDGDTPYRMRIGARVK